MIQGAKVNLVSMELKEYPEEGVRLEKMVKKAKKERKESEYQEEADHRASKVKTEPLE